MKKIIAMVFLFLFPSVSFAVLQRTAVFQEKFDTPLNFVVPLPGTVSSRDDRAGRRFYIVNAASLAGSNSAIGTDTSSDTIHLATDNSHRFMVDTVPIGIALGGEETGVIIINIDSGNAFPDTSYLGSEDVMWYSVFYGSTDGQNSENIGNTDISDSGWRWRVENDGAGNHTFKLVKIASASVTSIQTFAITGAHHRTIKTMQVEYSVTNAGSFHRMIVGYKTDTKVLEKSTTDSSFISDTTTDFGFGMRARTGLVENVYLKDMFLGKIQDVPAPPADTTVTIRRPVTNPIIFGSDAMGLGVGWF